MWLEESRQQETGPVICQACSDNQTVICKTLQCGHVGLFFDVPTVETVMIYCDDAILVKVEDWLFG